MDSKIVEVIVDTYLQCPIFDADAQKIVEIYNNSKSVIEEIKQHLKFDP